jgi:hypothetical protein
VPWVLLLMLLAGLAVPVHVVIWSGDPGEVEDKTLWWWSIK